MVHFLLPNAQANIRNLSNSKDSKKLCKLFGKYDKIMRTLSPQKVTMEDAVTTSA